MKASLLRAAVLLAASLAAAASSASADTLSKIADSGKIVLAYRESSVPFSYLDGPGKPIGFSVELSNAVVEAARKKLNKPALQVEYLAVTSQNRIPLVVNGTVDLECGSTTNNTARAKDVAFAINHFYTGTRLLVKKSSGVKDYADLANKKVATTTGTTNYQVIRKYSAEKSLNFDILLGKDHADAFLLVETDRAAAFAMDDILLFGLKANAKNPGEFDVVGESLQVEPYACMLRKDDAAFKQLVDDTIIGLMKSGEFERLYTKWFMAPIAPKGVALNLPMSPQLRDNLRSPSDKPAN
ncbi:transporter substrate-binding domain-containing protein [Variovorax terrae]|uniref:Transporter substrate-binding domain-containing protein n=1 Tax=Variovorax terrae TaxID=2923278 RepID=A0A9X1VPY8_9BURK|nr:transporter substrate-binding domain-containing protein [Variovorax terrae]MCJ0761666.1 transporter substrate-binding domain-containing protein [Variovorax terrae]